MVANNGFDIADHASHGNADLKHIAFDKVFDAFLFLLGES